MEYNKIRFISIILSVVTILLSSVLLGLLTNWLRYEISLEGFFVAIPLLATVIMIVPLCTAAYRHLNSNLLFLSFVFAVVGFIMVFAAYNHSFGGFPTFYINHVEQSPSTTIQTTNGLIEYWIELINPFSRYHREYLVLKSSGKENHIRINILEDSGGGYALANEPSDWATLYTRSKPDELLLVLGPHMPRSDHFIINLSKLTAIPNQMEAGQPLR